MTFPGNKAASSTTDLPLLRSGLSADADIAFVSVTPRDVPFVEVIGPYDRITASARRSYGWFYSAVGNFDSVGVQTIPVTQPLESKPELFQGIGRFHQGMSGAPVLVKGNGDLYPVVAGVLVEENKETVVLKQAYVSFVSSLIKMHRSELDAMLVLPSPRTCIQNGQPPLLVNYLAFAAGRDVMFSVPTAYATSAARADSLGLQSSGAPVIDQGLVVALHAAPDSLNKTVACLQRSTGWQKTASTLENLREFSTFLYDMDRRGAKPREPGKEPSVRDLGIFGNLPGGTKARVATTVRDLYTTGVDVADVLELQKSASPSAANSHAVLMNLRREASSVVETNAVAESPVGGIVVGFENGRRERFTLESVREMTFTTTP